MWAGGLGEPQMAAVAGGPVRRFAGQPFGSWSRDGRYAFTVVTGGTVRVEIGDQLARKARVVARMPYEAKGASGLGWLGDGSAVLYNGSASPGAELWTMRADGGGQRRLGGKAVMAPAWSRDGTKLAYASGDPAGGSRIVVADARGRKLSVVAPAAVRDGAERRQPELVAGRDEDRRRRHRGRRRVGRGREHGAPHAGRGRRGVAGLVPRRRHHRVRRHRRSHGLGRGARRCRSAPAPARVRGEDHGARLVARREAARVQHRRRGSISGRPTARPRRSS